LNQLASARYLGSNVGGSAPSFGPASSEYWFNPMQLAFSDMRREKASVCTYTCYANPAYFEVNRDESFNATQIVRGTPCPKEEDDCEMCNLAESRGS
jgi:hypothetical protein